MNEADSGNIQVTHTSLRKVHTRKAAFKEPPCLEVDDLAWLKSLRTSLTDGEYHFLMVLAATPVRLVMSDRFDFGVLPFGLINAVVYQYPAWYCCLCIRSEAQVFPLVGRQPSCCNEFGVGSKHLL
jgi:hypothetical protein